MINTEHIRQTLSFKERQLSDRHQIVEPGAGIPAETQAKWMIHLLQQVYTEHGIAKSPEKVIQSIASNQCRCWFILEDGTPVAMTALVTQSDGSVELGRAVALSTGLGLGGVAMMRAGLEQIENGTTPLVAEVRVADEFKGVPSGEATQRILFGQFKLKPHALAPMFNHGSPIRQEMFALSTSQDNQPSAPFAAPSHTRAVKILHPIMHLNHNLFKNEIHTINTQPKTHSFELVQTVPFSIVIPTTKGASLEKAEAAGMEINNFVLLPVELSPNNASLILECLESDWLPCGVDRNLGENSHPVLLLGKLRPNTLIAPTNIVMKNLGAGSVQAMRQIDATFRKPTR